MLTQSYLAVPGEPSSFTLLVTGLVTIGVYLVATGKLRAMRTAGAELSSQVEVPVDSRPTVRSQPTVAGQRREHQPAGLLDTIQAAVDMLRGDADLEETRKMERELSDCLSATETRIAELDALMGSSNKASQASSSKELETERAEVRSPQ